MKLVQFQIQCIVVAIGIGSLPSPAHAQVSGCVAEMISSVGGGVRDIEGGDRGLTFLAMDSGGLMILDSKVHTQPTFVASLQIDRSATDVEVAGDVVYLLSRLGPDSAISVIDVSDEADPTEIRRLELAGAATQIVRQSDRLYAACGDAGVKIFDISDPHNPELVSTIGSQGEAEGIYIDSDLIYIANTDRLTVVDVSIPGNPQTVSELMNFDSAEQVVGNGDGFIYLTGSLNQPLTAIDVRDPANPMISDQTVQYTTNADARIRNGYLYLGSWGQADGLRVYSLSDPAHLELVHEINNLGQTANLSFVDDVLYAASSTGEIQILGLNGPSDFSILGRFLTPYQAVGVSIKDGRLLVADRENGLLIMEVDDLSSPNVRAQIDIQSLLYDIDLQDDLLYLSGGDSSSSGSLTIIDVSNTDAPMVLSSLKTQQRVETTFIDGQYAYIGLEDVGFAIVDVSNQLQPEIVSTVSTGDSPRSLALEDGMLYVTQGLRDLLIYDVTNPAGPVQVDSMTTSLLPGDVLIANERAYILHAGSGGLSVYDVSLPSQPALLTQFQDVRGHLTSRLRIFDDVLYVCGSDDNIIAMDVRDPNSPSIFASFDGVRDPADVIVHGSAMFVAGSFHGVHTLTRSGCTPGCIADLNSDGVVQADDVLAFVAAYSQQESVADLNGDGVFNFYDVSGFIVAYNNGCE